MRIIKCDMCYKELSRPADIRVVTFNDSDEVFELCSECYSHLLSIAKSGCAKGPGDDISDGNGDIGSAKATATVKKELKKLLKDAAKDIDSMDWSEITNLGWYLVNTGLQGGKGDHTAICTIYKDDYGKEVEMESLAVRYGSK